MPRPSLHAFLSSSRTALKSAIRDASPVTLVLGNESADLDSLCCAVILAYFRTHWPASQPRKSSAVHIPISCVPQDDLPLRTELHTVLRHAGLQAKDLITLSDLSSSDREFKNKLRSEQTSLLLVDHNALTPAFRDHYSEKVIGCIDHHAEEFCVPQDCGAEPRIIRKAGSCSSLVVEYCREAWDELSKQASVERSDHAHDIKLWDREIAMLALAPVLSDSVNLMVKSKTEDVDVEAVKFLEDKIRNAEGEGFDRDVYFQEIKASMEDLDALSLDDILRKDYKSWKLEDIDVGVSAVVRPLQYLIDKAGGNEAFLRSLKEFAKPRHLSTCVVMTIDRTEKEARRELLVWGLDQRGIETVKKFEETSSLDLKLCSWADGSLNADHSSESRRCWQQGNVDASRKQVAPLLRSAMSESLSGRASL